MYKRSNPINVLVFYWEFLYTRFVFIQRDAMSMHIVLPVNHNMVSLTCILEDLKHVDIQIYTP